MWSNPWSFLALFSLVWLLWWAWKARHRLIVEEFINYTDKQLSPTVQGLATLLVVRLGQLHSLYRAVDEQRAFSTSVLENESIDATLKVVDIGEILKDTVSSQSELGLGPMKIPIGALMSLIGRFVQGPRIHGSLHNDGDKLILTSQSVGAGNSFKWRVDQVLPPMQTTEAHSPDLVCMVQELACRIFTDIALNGAVRWEAATAFSEGLREYRECLHISKDKKAHLYQAEKKFIETIAEDTQFTLAYYNLGVVYTELGQMNAAETAFEKAIVQSPNSWEAYYALALSRYDSKNYYRTIQLCKRCIELKPKSANLAKAYQLKGLAERTLYDEAKKKSTIPLNSNYLKKSDESCKQAVMYSWVALCFAELKKQDIIITKESRISRLETLASLCVADLVKADKQQESKDHQKKHQQAEIFLNQALSLTHVDGNYHALYYSKRGKIYFSQQKYADATNEHRRATRIAPESVTYWAELALAYAYAITCEDKSRERETRDIDYEKYVLETIIDFASSAEAKDYNDALVQAAQAYDMLDKGSKSNNDRRKSMNEIKEFVEYTYFFNLLDSLEITKKKDEFEEKLHSYEHTHDFSLLGRLYLAGDGRENCQGLIMALERQLKQHNEKKEEMIGARISLTLGQWYHKCNELQKINTLIENLEQQLKNIKSDGNEWEHGQRLQILTRLHLLTGQFGEAEKKCRLAIQKLEKKYPREVREQHLWTLLASTLSKQGKYYEAVQVDQQAVLLDALDCSTYQHLGDMYLERQDIEQAIHAWTAALSRKSVAMQNPYDPEIDFKLGKAYARLAQQHHELGRKNIENRKALEHFRQALEHFGEEQQKQKLAVYYHLGYFHFTLSEYEDAIKYFRISQGFGFAQLESLFYLGDAFLRLREYDEAIQQFRTLFDCTKRSLTPIREEEKPIGHISLDELPALAKWGEAFAHAERGTDLQYALELIDKARKLIKPAFKQHIKDKVQYPARYPDCKGWILHKLGRSDDAIKWLEDAVKLEVHAEIYLHLALAYEAKLQKIHSRVQKQHLIERVRVCCQHIRELDPNGQYEKQVHDLLQRP